MTSRAKTASGSSIFPVTLLSQFLTSIFMTPPIPSRHLDDPDVAVACTRNADLEEEQVAFCVYFDDLRDAVGLPKGKLAFPDQGAMAVGVPDEQIAMIYQASDVLLLPSMGEGFGLPVLEAQACGCPVITQDCSAMTELTINGTMVKPLQPMWLPQIKYYWQIPAVQDIVRALEEVHGREDAEKQSAQGVKFVQDLYDYDVVWEQHWLPFLRKIEMSIW